MNNNDYVLRKNGAGHIQGCTSCDMGVPTRPYKPTSGAHMEFKCVLCSRTMLGQQIVSAATPDMRNLAKGIAQAQNIIAGKLGVFNAEIADFQRAAAEEAAAMAKSAKSLEEVGPF